MRLQAASRPQFLTNIQKPENLPIGTSVRVVNFDERGIIFEKMKSNSTTLIGIVSSFWLLAFFCKLTYLHF